MSATREIELNSLVWFGKLLTFIFWLGGIPLLITYFALTIEIANELAFILWGAITIYGCFVSCIFQGLLE